MAQQSVSCRSSKIGGPYATILRKKMVQEATGTREYDDKKQKEQTVRAAGGVN
jgi:hypothetical protein